MSLFIPAPAGRHDVHWKPLVSLAMRHSIAPPNGEPNVTDMFTWLNGQQYNVTEIIEEWIHLRSAIDELAQVISPKDATERQLPAQVLLEALNYIKDLRVHIIKGALICPQSREGRLSPESPGENRSEGLSSLDENGFSSEKPKICSTCTYYDPPDRCSCKHKTQDLLDTATCTSWTPTPSSKDKHSATPNYIKPSRCRTCHFFIRYDEGPHVCAIQQRRISRNALMTDCPHWIKKHS